MDIRPFDSSELPEESLAAEYRTGTASNCGCRHGLEVIDGLDWCRERLMEGKYIGNVSLIHLAV